MGPNYKLTYFPLTGLAEGIRFLLSYGNIKFEDERIAYDDWFKAKASTPFGKVPFLEIDGKKMSQSGAICRYLAKQMNLTGKDEWDSLQIDIIVDTIGDLRWQIAGYYYDPNEETKASKYEPLMKETIPFYMSRFEKIVAENGGYLVGGQLTWADLYFVGIFDFLGKLVRMDLYKGYPNLTRMKEKVVNIPQIKAWIEKRPEEILFTFKK